MRKHTTKKSTLIYYKNNLSKSNGGIKGENLLLNILAQIKFKFKQNPQKKLEKMITNISPGAILSPRYFAGRVSYVPSPISDTQAHYKVIKWIRESPRIKQNMADKFIDELLQSTKKTGNLWNLKKKYTHELQIARLNMRKKRKFRLSFSKKRKISKSKKLKKFMSVKKWLKFKKANKDILMRTAAKMERKLKAINPLTNMPPDPKIKILKQIINKKKRNNQKYYSEYYRMRSLHYKNFITFTTKTAPFRRRVLLIHQKMADDLKKKLENNIKKIEEKSGEKKS